MTYTLYNDTQHCIKVSQSAPEVFDVMKSAFWESLCVSMTCMTGFPFNLARLTSNSWFKTICSGGNEALNRNGLLRYSLHVSQAYLVS